MSGTCIITPLVILLLSAACSIDEKKQDTAEEASEEQTTDTVQVVKDSVPPPLEEPGLFVSENELPGRTRLQALSVHVLGTYDTAPNPSVLLPDRFGALQSHKIAYVRKQDVMLRDSSVLKPIARLWYFKYADTLQQQNVIRNWFLEFGADRREIEIDSAAGGFTELPTIAIINPKELAILQYDCHEYESFDWQWLRQSFSGLFENEESKLLLLDCRGNLSWK